MLPAVEFGLCCSFLPITDHLSALPLRSLSFALAQVLCLDPFPPNLGRISNLSSMFLNPFSTFLSTASKVCFSCAPGLMGFGFDSSFFSHASTPFCVITALFSSASCSPTAFYSYLTEALSFIDFRLIGTCSYISSMAVFSCNSDVNTVAETLWPGKPKLFIVWHLAKKTRTNLADSCPGVTAGFPFQPRWMAGHCVQLPLHVPVPTSLFLHLLLVLEVPLLHLPCLTFSFSDQGWRRNCTCTRTRCQHHPPRPSTSLSVPSPDGGTITRPPPTSCPFVFWLSSPRHVPPLRDFSVHQTKSCVLR